MVWSTCSGIVDACVEASSSSSLMFNGGWHSNFNGVLPPPTLLECEPELDRDKL